MRNTALTILVGVLAIVIGVGVVVGGWQAGWWFKTQNINREYQTNTHSQQYVQAQIDHLRNLDEGFNASTDSGQQGQIRNEFCAIYQALGQAPPMDLVHDSVLIGCP